MFANFFKPKFAPALIDLLDYEKTLLYQREHHIGLMPPCPIPGLLETQWSEAEMQAMTQNRVQAREIYNRISKTAQER